MKHKQCHSHGKRLKELWAFFLERHSGTDTSLYYSRDICAHCSAFLCVFLKWTMNEMMLEKSRKESLDGRRYEFGSQRCHFLYLSNKKKDPWCIIMAKQGLYSASINQSSQTKTFNFCLKPGVYITFLFRPLNSHCHLLLLKTSTLGSV